MFTVPKNLPSKYNDRVKKLSGIEDKIEKLYEQCHEIQDDICSEFSADILSDDNIINEDVWVVTYTDGNIILSSDLYTHKRLHDCLATDYHCGTELTNKISLSFYDNDIYIKCNKGGHKDIVKFINKYNIQTNIDGVSIGLKTEQKILNEKLKSLEEIKTVLGSK